MGLDMYLHAEKYLPGYDFRKDPAFDAVVEAIGLAPSDGSPHVTVSVCVAYWRKANQIHRWFVENVQGGTDDCEPYTVSIDSLRTLRDLCQQVLRDRSTAADLLPAQEGFFFGGTEYDEWYYDDVEDTVKQLTPLIEDQRFEDFHWSFQYRSSW